MSPHEGSSNPSERLQERLHERGREHVCPVVVLMKDGKVLIGLRHYTADKWKEISVWTFPGGRCDAGETVEETLRRETGEETGIAELEITAFSGEVPGAKAGDIVYVFMGKTEAEPELREPEKFSEWRWSRIEDIPSNFINPPLLHLVRQHLSSKP